MQKNSLVIFKSKPAKVIQNLDKKIHIQTLDGKDIKLPPKNVQFLTQSNCDFELKDINLLEIDDLEGVWELLQEENKTTIEELSEFFFENTNVNEVYTVWNLISDGLYFSFDNDDVLVHTEEQKNIIQAEREEKNRKEKEINDFINRIKNKTYEEKDSKFIQEIINLALLKNKSCRFFKFLGMEENENNAHKLLLDIGFWNEFNNPFLHRYGAELQSNNEGFDYIDTVNRVDLTYMTSYAIDDEGSNDPDDAISWDEKNQKMWVHIADPSSAINFNDNVDLQARARGSNLYVPEGIVSMLPQKATDIFGLGLSEVSPSLSIGFKIDNNGDISNVEICFSNIKVTRLSYEYAEKNIHKLNLENIIEYCQAFTKKRINNQAVELDFPEIKIKLDNKKVSIIDLPKLGSRILVRDCMLMAGVATGKFTLENNIPVPYSTQEQHELTTDDINDLNTPSKMFAARRKLKRGKHSTECSKHSGMGIDNYVQVTSPLRRYLDLVVHYQLRNFLTNKDLISTDKINELIALVELPIKSNRQTESYCNTHWKLVYLMQNQEWEGRATVLEVLDRSRAFLSIDSLAITKKMSLSEKYEENNIIELLNTNVNLVTQEAYFKEKII